MDVLPANGSVLFTKTEGRSAERSPGRLQLIVGQLLTTRGNLFSRSSCGLLGSLLSEQVLSTSLDENFFLLSNLIVKSADIQSDSQWEGVTANNANMREVYRSKINFSYIPRQIGYRSCVCINTSSGMKLVEVDLNCS